eukprot:5872934-Prymnesium_polylepis.1
MPVAHESSRMRGVSPPEEILRARTPLAASRQDATARVSSSAPACARQEWLQMRAGVRAEGEGWGEG